MIIVPVILAGINYRKNFFSLYLITALLFQIAFYYTSRQGINNWWLLDIFCNVEYWLIGVALLLILKSLNVSPAIYIAFFLVGLLILAVTALKPGTQLNLRIQNFSMVLLSAYTAIEFVKNDLSHELLRDTRFWITAGVFIYFTSVTIIYTFLLFLGANEVEETRIYFTHLLSIVNIVSYILYSLGYLCRYPRPT